MAWHWRHQWSKWYIADVTIKPAWADEYDAVRQMRHCTVCGFKQLRSFD